MSKKRISRKQVSDPSINSVLQDIYDKLQDLQPTIDTFKDKRPPSLGQIDLVQKEDGNLQLRHYTKTGWLEDINSSFKSVGNTRPNSKSNIKAPQAHKALSFNKEGKVIISSRVFSDDVSPVELYVEGGGVYFSNTTGMALSSAGIGPGINCHTMTVVDDASSFVKFYEGGGTRWVAGYDKYDRGNSFTCGGTSDTTAKSTTVTMDDTTPGTNTIAAEMRVQGTGIADGTTVVSVDSGTNITISQAATSTNLNTTLTFLPKTRNYIIEPGAGTSSRTPTLQVTEDDITKFYGTTTISTVSSGGHSTSLKIDADTSGDSAQVVRGLAVDLDRTVATSGTDTHFDTGIDVDVNSATLGTSTVRGIDIDVVGATSGDHTAIGLDIDADGADTNIGMVINTTGTHIKLTADADPGDDYATLAVADTGDLTIATAGDGARDSDIHLDADGVIKFDSAAGGFYFMAMAAASAEISNYGQLWVATVGIGQPNELSYTDSAGTDIVGIGKYHYESKVTNFYATATTSYLPLAGYIVERTSTTSNNEYIAMVAPYNGVIEKIMFRSEAAQSGNLDYYIYESTDGTETPGTETGHRREAINIADDTVVDVGFATMTSGTRSITKGRIYAIKIVTPSNPLDTNVTVVFKWDITS